MTALLGATNHFPEVAFSKILPANMLPFEYRYKILHFDPALRVQNESVR